MKLQWLLNASNVAILVGAVIAALGAWGNFYFREKIDAEKQQIQQARLEQERFTAAERDRRLAQDSKEKAEESRRSRLLAQLRRQYILSHDGIKPEIIAGTAPLPRDWVLQQLRKRGESWEPDEHY